MRYDLIRAYSGDMSSLPVMSASSVVYQRSCAAMEAIIDKAAKVQRHLPGVVADLRRAAPQLVATCIAPPRTLDTPLDRISRVLGDNVTAANTAVVDGQIRSMIHTNPNCGAL